MRWDFVVLRKFASNLEWALSVPFVGRSANTNFASKERRDHVTLLRYDKGVCVRERERDVAASPRHTKRLDDISIPSFFR